MHKAVSVGAVAFASALLFSSTQSLEEAAVQKEIDEKQFAIAKEMFIPWYTGPLITGSSTTVPKGHINIQPYLFGTNDFGRYTSNRKTVNVEDRWVVNPLFLFQLGLSTSMDLTLAPQGVFQWRGTHSGYGFGDTALNFGFQLMEETPRSLSIRMIIGETFPSGRYENLSVNKGGLDATGSGAYSTTLGLNLGKILFWFPVHPMRLRLSGSYEIPNNTVSVHGFHAYGGGFGADGKVDVGRTLNLDFGYEISLTQKWVLACDLAYTHSDANHFSGNPGTNADGTPATTAEASSDQLSIAPAIEYNPNDRGGFIGGIWLSITGRNASQFAGVVLSYTYLF